MTSPRETRHVTVNLDKWEKELVTVEPFSFTHNAKKFSMVDPQTIDWATLVGAQVKAEEGDPRLFLVLMLGEEQYDKFVKSGPCSVRKLGHLIDTANDYYGLTKTSGEAPASQA